MGGLKRRYFLIEKLIHMIIITRAFTYQYLPLQAYIGIVIGLFILQYLKEGLTPFAAMLLILLSLQGVIEIAQQFKFLYFSSILGVFLSFFPIKLYFLPQPQKIAGFRKDVLSSGLEYYELYPLDETQNISLKPIKWHNSKQIQILVQSANIKNSIIHQFFNIILSYIDKQYIKTGQGIQSSTKYSLAFCHGRACTPFMYSTFLMHFVGLNYKVGAVQHNQIRATALKDKAEIKKYRQKQVAQRASEFYQTILRLNNQKIVLMGHSYGGGTLIQAYHTLQKALKEKITHIILLDPWLFSLTQQKFNQQFQCPVLFLANQDYASFEDMHNRNKVFLKVHNNIQYINWKNAHHMHQSDMGFISGNLFGAIKNSHLSKIMLDLNFDAIDKFLKNQKIEGTYGSKDLGRHFIPSKFRPQSEYTY